MRMRRRRRRRRRRGRRLGGINKLDLARERRGESTDRLLITSTAEPNSGIKTTLDPLPPTAECLLFLSVKKRQL
jgi:hypothetical protein